MICSILTLSSCSQSNTIFVYPFHYVFSGRLSLGSFIAILLIYLFIHIYFFLFLLKLLQLFYLFFMAQAGVLSSRKDDEGKKRKVNVP